MSHHPGDIVNGQILGSDNQWDPISVGTTTATLEPAAAPAPVRKSRPLYRRWWFIGAAGVALLAVIASAGVALSSVMTSATSGEDGTTMSSSESNRFVQAVDRCSVPTYLDVVSDGGATIVLVGKGDEDSIGMTIDQIRCVLNGLGVPGRVTSEMASMRALDGVQTDSWDGISARWSYHPDSGLKVILSDTTPRAT